MLAALSTATASLQSSSDTLFERLKEVKPVPTSRFSLRRWRPAVSWWRMPRSRLKKLKSARPWRKKSNSYRCSQFSNHVYVYVYVCLIHYRKTILLRVNWFIYVCSHIYLKKIILDSNDVAPLHSPMIADRKMDDEIYTRLIDADAVEYLDFMKTDGVKINKPIGSGNFSSVYRVKY